MLATLIHRVNSVVKPVIMSAFKIGIMVVITQTIGYTALQIILGTILFEREY
jgi:hypothetical protein